MKKRNLTVLLLSSFLLVGCGSGQTTKPDNPPIDNPTPEPNPEPNPNPQPEPNPDPEPPIDTRTPFEKALEQIQNVNIAFESEVFEVNTTIAKPEEVTRNSFGKRNVYFEDGKYRLDSFNKDGQKEIELTFYRDSKGFAANKFLDINNVVHEEPLGEPGQYFKWSLSVYYNLFSELKVDNFVKVNETTYTLDLTKKGFESWGNYLASSIGGFNTFDTKTVTLTLVGDKVDTISFAETDFKDGTSPYLYRREMVTKVKSVGDVKVSLATPYEHTHETTDLENAIKAMKSSTSYTTTLEAFSFGTNGQFNPLAEFTEVSHITQEDIATFITYPDNTKSVKGLHTNGNGYGEYKGEYAVDGTLSLTENLFHEGKKISSLLPTYNFSCDIFKLTKTLQNGDKIYTLRDNRLANVLLELTHESFASSYYGTVPITLTVSKGKLKTLTFDAAGLESYYKYVIDFSDFNTTTVDQAMFANYVKLTPVLSYKDERLTFMFMDDTMGKYNEQMLTFDKFFTIAFGANYNVPLYESFTPSADEYFGGITIDPDTNEKICEISSICVNTKTLDKYIQTLISSGFVAKPDPTNNYQTLYVKGDLTIGIADLRDTPDQIMLLGFIVPATNFLTK